jgi:hypothetical protein
MFIIGNGDTNVKANIFQVLEDGRATVISAPKDSIDVVRLGEIEKL